MALKKHKKLLIALAILVLVLAVSIPVIVLAVSKAFTAQEHEVRTDWSFETGDLITESQEWQVDITKATLGDGLNAVQLVPQDISQEGFTFYDLEVQQRLEGALQSLKDLADVSWTATTPLCSRLYTSR